MKTTYLSVAVVSSLLLVHPGVRADSVTHSVQGSGNASIEFSAAMGEIVSGSASAIIDSGRLVITGIKETGESVVIALKGVSEQATASLKVSRTALGAALLSVGTVVTVVAESTGHALLASGKLIGFIPNEVGTSLLHHSQHEGV